MLKDMKDWDFGYVSASVGGTDLSTIGCYMGDGALAALLAPPSVKDALETDAADESGTLVHQGTPVLDKRQVDVPFTVFGDTLAEYVAHREALLSLFLASTLVELRVDLDGTHSLAYTVRYREAGATTHWNGLWGLATLCLEEPDPSGGGLGTDGT